MLTVSNRARGQSSKVTLKIPRPLYEKIERVILGSGYNSVTDFVVYVLRDLVASHRRGAAERGAEELEVVKDRLKALGYMPDGGASESGPG